ncbi:MAG: trypsin-like peptidase domain-containing protein [Lachnospiraceae bacterium]|nr:trypsin-like peptidase domain-containing protein [Lachnospiraceae bacterium]
MEQFENKNYYDYGQSENYGQTESYGQAAGNGDTGNAWYRPYEEPQPPKKKNGFGLKVVKYVALGLVFGVVAGAAFAGTSTFFGKITGNESSAKEEELQGDDLHIAKETEMEETLQDVPLSASGAVTDVSGIVEQVMPSIVSITTIAKTQVPSFFYWGMEEYESEGCGSGIIISQDEENLYIATNNHVVAGADTLTVFFADEASVNAQIKGTDESTDLAVVAVALDEIDAETKAKIKTATFGDSKDIRVGQTAVAIGNALGYGQSVTTGVISAVDREVTVTNETDGSLITNELLQTDAAINPGNSGGALLNLKGEVIGINSVKYSETSVEGMGYAIPADTAIPIIKQLITREVVNGMDSAYLGISGVDVTQSVSETYNMPQGVYVAQVVEGSGAAQAGLVQGDIITRFDGRNITSMEEIQSLLQYLSAGDTVEVTIERAQNGEYVESTLQVVLGRKR